VADQLADLHKNVRQVVTGGISTSYSITGQSTKLHAEWEAMLSMCVSHQPWWQSPHHLIQAIAPPWLVWSNTFTLQAAHTWLYTSLQLDSDSSQQLDWTHKHMANQMLLE